MQEEAFNSNNDTHSRGETAPSLPSLGYTLAFWVDVMGVREQGMPVEGNVQELQNLIFQNLL